MSDKRKQVLLVDDDVDYVEANRVALESLGFAVLTAADSREGVRLAEAAHPDLVVRDLMLERLYAGFSALESLYAHESTRDIPVIMVSGVTTETGFRVDENGCKPEWLKVVEFINKPVDPVELARKVASILGEQK